MAKTRRYWKNKRCWDRRAKSGARYTVCTGSKGQKGVYQKKGRGTRKGKGRKGKGRKTRRGQRGGVGAGIGKVLGSKIAWGRLRGSGLRRSGCPRASSSPMGSKVGAGCV